MDKHKIPQLRVRLNQEQHQWLLDYVEKNQTNVNAFLKALVNQKMLEVKNDSE